MVTCLCPVVGALAREDATDAPGRQAQQGTLPIFVVLAGRRPGFYTTWLECAPKCEGLPGAKCSGYVTLAEAPRAWAQRDGG